jgi:hypothetical protein
MFPALSGAARSLLLLASVSSSVAIGQEGPAAPGTDRRFDRRGCVGSLAFDGKLDIEVSPLALAPGKPYALKVFLKNTGGSAMKLKHVEMAVRINAEWAPALEPSLVTKDVAVTERRLVAEGNGEWRDDAKVWVALVKITGENGDTCQDRIALRKGY